ncbi:MAG: hypothetical protein ACRDOC_05020 [Streptosporangiaceae bacterium]
MPPSRSHSPVVASFAPEPFVSGGEAAKGLEELADLDQGAVPGTGDRRHRPQVTSMITG